MRYFSLLLFGLTVCALPAVAQVTVDMNALDALKKSAPNPVAPKPKAPKPEAAPIARELPRPPAPAMAPAAPKPPAIFKAPLPPLPVAPPPTPALAPLPPSVAPVNKPASTLTAPVLASAAGTGTAFPGGMRITFGNGQGELSPASEQSLKTLVRQAPPSETVSYNVLAYAPGTPEDPSTARRLSLARGLAVRSVLMSAGVASARIYVRALGAPVGAAAGSATPDRVDVSLLGTNAPPDPPTSSPAAPETGAARTP